jgi:hypothetical protein
VRLPARGKAMQARPWPSSSPATRSPPLSCDVADQARDDVALGLFGCLQLFELLDGQIKLNRFLHERAQLVRLDGV